MKKRDLPRIATCTAPHAIFPLGGTVDGVDQMAHHGNQKAGIPRGEVVTITVEKDAAVETYGGAINSNKVKVVGISGKHGMYLASAFA